MGNTPSDSLGHSFKRLRLSETEQLSHTSPSSVSPKRKIVLTTNKELNDTITDLIDNSNDETPVILCDNVDRSSTIVIPTLQPSRADAKKDSGKASCLKDDPSFYTQSFATSLAKNPENGLANIELSDEEIIMCLRSGETNPHLSDADVIHCLQHTYGHKER